MNTTATSLHPLRTALMVGFLLLSVMPGYGGQRIDLNGQWHFMLDPQRVGETWNWQATTLPTEGQWYTVDVPHCWPVDQRFPYTGLAWYRRTFTVPREAANQHVRLAFDAVFYRAKVWLNGRLLGEHEGGYTPFEFDVTGEAAPGRESTLVVEVDNSWSVRTIPGARPGGLPRDQFYPWWDYGGIVRDAYLLVTSPHFVANQRVVATPDLASGQATVDITIWVANAGATAAQVRLQTEIRQERTQKVAGSWRQDPRLSVVAPLPPRTTSPVQLHATLPAADVALWDQDHPTLYQLHTEIRKDEPTQSALEDAHEVTFGIRKIEVRKTELLLNGRPIRMGGANRHSDHPKFGLIEPKEVVDTDMALMKTANMEFEQIPHYPTAPALLDWADRNGCLLIEETGNTWLTPEQMESVQMRALFQSQTEEMVRRDWNHPSVIAWSMGNEYDSDTPAGVRWTKDMYAFTRALDPQRLITFGSNHAYRTNVQKPEDEGSQYADLVSASMFDDLELMAQNLDRIHSLWPEKPVFVGQWAYGAPEVVRDPAKIQAYIHSFMALVRQRPFVVGASYWAFADYRSRWPYSTTEADGYRHFGVVTRDRSPKPVYEILRKEFSPVVIREIAIPAQSPDGAEPVPMARLLCRADFPSYEIRDYEIRWQLLDANNQPLCQASKKLTPLEPGQEQRVELPFSAAQWRGAFSIKVQVVRPTGFVVTDQTVPLPTKGN